MSAKNYTVVVARRTDSQSPNELGTDALNGIQSIPGVLNAEVISEKPTEVIVTFEWDGRPDFQMTDEHLQPFGVQKVWAST